MESRATAPTPGPSPSMTPGPYATPAGRGRWPRFCLKPRPPALAHPCKVSFGKVLSTLRDSQIKPPPIQMQLLCLDHLRGACTGDCNAHVALRLRRSTDDRPRRAHLRAVPAWMEWMQAPQEVPARSRCLGRSSSTINLCACRICVTGAGRTRIGPTVCICMS